MRGSYLRFPADLPSAGRRVVLCLHVRRFACADASCGRRTFAEQVPGLTRRYGRWTERLRSALAEVGLALAGRAGARIADVFGIRVSRSTVLPLVDALPEPRPRTPRVVGRRIRDAQGPGLRDRAGRRRDRPTRGPAA
ncbi:hypothetical protein [Streptomyces nigrescens]|uniref:Transposase n=1 Tax=Streptomyces nigrescens TaxID=1920 RepID=A0ABY7I701_STRNI|nr:hypothetical protein [Streptomyces libani]WAT94494.1 hypothetical protein STRLI_000119 [Streptomyces libani subsp. libani]